MIYKVQIAVHGSGRPYAKRLVEIHEGEWGFEYAPGVVRNLSADTLLTLEEARQFGALYGTCCVCGRTLTNEESIGYGIGPVCRKGFPPLINRRPGCLAHPGNRWQGLALPERLPQRRQNHRRRPPSGRVAGRAWEDAYLDAAAGRPKWHYANCDGECGYH